MSKTDKNITTKDEKAPLRVPAETSPKPKKQQSAQSKAALWKAIIAKKEEWRQEDIRHDEETRKNIVRIKAELETSLVKLNEYKAQLKLFPENPDLKAEFVSFNKDHQRILQRLRIEKHRVSFGYKVERFSKRGGRLRRELYLKRQYYYLVAPYTILFLIFTVIPVLMSLFLSFTNFNMLEMPNWVGWDNYMRLFIDDKIFVIAIRNTLILAVVTGPLSYLAAFVFAWLINELKPRLRAFMTLIFYAPSISGNVYLVWKLIFSSDIYGYANAFLIRWGFINEPITWLQDPKYIIYIVMIVQLWLSLGVSFLAFIAGLQSVNRELYEAGAVDGIKNRWQELWYITLPQMKSQLMFGAVMQITSSLAIAEVTTNIAGFPSISYSAHTIINHLTDYGSLRLEMGYASAIATILFVIMIVANILVRKIIRRVGS